MTTFPETVSVRTLAAICAACLGTTSLSGAEPEDLFRTLGDEYASSTRAIIVRYCADCHATAEPEGELDLERFATLADVRGGTEAWVKVAEALDDAQMPPEGADQPTPEEKTRLREWTRRYLDAEARAAAGDPGPVPLRRLSNAEYTYTARDLTGVADRDPAKEFPADGAAGEGFTNASEALAMSPALLTKYLDAGKEIARHAVLLPDGFRFSGATTREDQTGELLAEIRNLYGKYSDAQGAQRVNLQGIEFATNDGGRLPLERYLDALRAAGDSADRDALVAIARERGLSQKYLVSLCDVLAGGEKSPLLDELRARWKAGDSAGVAAEVARWQATLNRFQSVGHMKPWVVSVDPLTTRQEVRVKLPATTEEEVSLFLATGDAGDGNGDDFVVWERPRLVAPGRPELLLKDVRAAVRRGEAARDRLFAVAGKSLAAAGEASGEERADPVALAAKHGVEPELLSAWFDYLGIGPDATASLSHFTQRMENVGGHDFVDGWGTGETPLLVANASETHVRIPGNMKGHGVAVHPSPGLAAVVAWRSPVEGKVRVSGAVTHAHPECGNGTSWALDLRRGNVRRPLAGGIAHGSTTVAFGPLDGFAVRTGDVLCLSIGPRDANHSCDLTDVELVVATGDREWRLTKDVAGDVLAGNPHADGFGNPGVWHFATEPADGSDVRPGIPDGSVVARWQAAATDQERTNLAGELQRLLEQGPPADGNHPDAVLYRQLASLGGPLLSRVPAGAVPEEAAATGATRWGLDPAAFGRHPEGGNVDGETLCVKAPGLIEVKLPAGLAADAEFMATAVLHPETGHEGSAQVLAAATAVEPPRGLRNDLPVLVADGGPARERFARGFTEFRNWFPAALCYTKIVPVDEVITLTLHHREDEPLSRLMLDQAEQERLDRLWEEVRFVSRDALTIVDAYAQLMEYATQDADPRVFEPLRKQINDGAAAFRQKLIEAEPRQVEVLIAFAAKAFRRPLDESEAEDLRALYRRLREEGLAHEEAFRLTLARVFASPAFLYRLESAPEGPAAGPVTDWELATRLSYFLWSSAPDQHLRDAAAAGRLRDPDFLASEARRMLADERVRRLATEFACQWLQIYEFDEHDEKSEQAFPQFGEVRDELYEEPIRFFADLFARDGSVLEVLDADHTFVNEALAAHYGIEGVAGPEWRRVDAVKSKGRGGILGFGATLAKQSGASRTSPTLRGNWISEVLIGEKLPKPPKGVPPLPDDGTAGADLTVREMFERHAEDPACAKCHVRIDPLGFALESYDPIGRRVEADAAGRPVDVKARLQDGTEFVGVDGLRAYLLTDQRDAVVRQFCKKLLGYALGRSVRLSDEPLLEEMQAKLEANGYRFSAAVEAVVRSRQFREIRGRDAVVAENP